MKPSITCVAPALPAPLARSACAAAPPIKPASTVDLPQYLGRRCAIASIPARFERGGVNAAEPCAASSGDCA